MRSWIFSLQFRLIVGFALVLALALLSLSWYVASAAKRETQRFEQDVGQVRAARVEQALTQHYAERRGWVGVQPVIERAGDLYGWRIVVTDGRGTVVGESRPRAGRLPRHPQERRLFPIMRGDSQVASVEVDMAPEQAPMGAAEPPASRLASKLRMSLIWTGLAAGGAGILLVSLLSRQLLAPVRGLTGAARRLGRGDLSQRVKAGGVGEMAELGRTFNSMAQGLQEAERQRRNLMADVAHELRTPLSNIQGYLEAVRDGLLQPDKQTIDILHQQVLFLARLVEDLRLLALAESGALGLRPELDSLEQLLRRSVEAVRPRAKAGGVSISLELQDGFPLVDMDATRISQVVSNLLDNAIAYTPQGGTVAVRAEVVGGTLARVAVADTGVGIPPADLARVFERFYRVDHSRARSTGGVGLGLTIARQLVEAHGGAIRAESTPGKGSTFTFDLPLTRAGGDVKARGG